MKTYLLPQSGSFYKTNLHCHSTLSDGHLSPEELKAAYKAAGYAVLAYSDHNVLVDHSDLNDETFLAMTAVEIDVKKTGEVSKSYLPTYHVNFFPRDQHQTALCCPPKSERRYDQIGELISGFVQNGFLAMVNHPTWSLQGFEDYRDLEGVFAMEIYNHGCVTIGYSERNDHLYDQLLRAGKPWFCTAIDDAHSKYPIGTADSDMFGGFVMVKAQALTQEAIFDALQAGHFYASTGPEIHELYVDEENKLHVKTSPAKSIQFTCAYRHAAVAFPASPHTYLGEAVFDLSAVRPGYVRVTVTDANGNQAWSQPLFGNFSGKVQDEL